MGANQGHTRDQSAGSQGLGTLSLAPILSGQLFGYGTGISGNGDGSLSFRSNSAQGLPSFNMDDFAPLRNLTNTYGSFIGGADTYNQIGQQAKDVLTNTLPGINELQQTGFADEINQLSSFLFENELAPQLEEQFGASLGLDTGDSDTRAAMIREAQRTAFESANAGVQNRITGLQLAQQAPTNVAGAAGGVEQLLQQGSRQSSPEGQLLDLIMQLTGVDTQGGGVGDNTSKGTGTSHGFSMK